MEGLWKLHGDCYPYENKRVLMIAYPPDKLHLAENDVLWPIHLGWFDKPGQYTIIWSYVAEFPRNSGELPDYTEANQRLQVLIDELDKSDLIYRDSN